MTNEERVEKLAEWLYHRVSDENWATEVKRYKDTYRKDATDVLAFIESTLGAVWLAGDQTIKPHDMNSASFAEGYGAAIEDIKAAGFRRIEEKKWN